MRLLITLGYQSIVVSKDADYSSLIEAITTGQAVDKSYVDGKYVYVPTTRLEVEAKFVDDSEVAAATGEDGSSIGAAFAQVTKEKTELQSKVWELERKLKAATNKVDTVTNAVKEAVEIPF